MAMDSWIRLEQPATVQIQWRASVSRRRSSTHAVRTWVLRFFLCSGAHPSLCLEFRRCQLSQVWRYDRPAAERPDHTALITLNDVRQLAGGQQLQLSGFFVPAISPCFRILARA